MNEKAQIRKIIGAWESLSVEKVAREINLSKYELSRVLSDKPCSFKTWYALMKYFDLLDLNDNVVMPEISKKCFMLLNPSAKMKVDLFEDLTKKKKK